LTYIIIILTKGAPQKVVFSFWYFYLELKLCGDFIYGQYKSSDLVNEGSLVWE